MNTIYPTVLAQGAVRLYSRLAAEPREDLWGWLIVRDDSPIPITIGVSRTAYEALPLLLVRLEGVSQ